MLDWEVWQALGARYEGIHEGRVALASAQSCKLLRLDKWRSSYRCRWIYENRLRGLEGTKRIRKATGLLSKSQAFVLIFVATFFLPSLAFAATNIYGFAKIIYGPVSYKWEGVTYYEYGVAAYSKYDAAAVTIGFNPDDFTEEQKAKLSNESTGGAFWTYAQLFDNPPVDGLSASVTGNGYVAVSPGFWTTAYGIYGEGNVWYAEVTGAQRIAAQIDLRVVLTGGDLGGSGGGETVSGDYTLIPLQDWEPHEHTGLYDVDYAAIRTDIYESLESYANANGQSILVRIGRSSVTGQARAMAITAPKSSVAFYDTYSNRTYVNYWLNPFTTHISDSNYTVSEILTLDGKRCARINATIKSSNYPKTVDGFYPVKAYAWNDETTTVIPPTQWPDDPTPTVPEPPSVDPPTTPTEPTTPTNPTPPTYPPEVNYPDVTYTDADISAVLDAMNEHCEHITSAVYNAGASLYSSLSSYLLSEFSATRGLMRSLSVWEVEAIGGYFDAMFGYFDDLTEWLDSRLQFDTIVDILMRIYGSLPSMDATEGYLEDILSSLTNMQDEDTNVPLIRGYLKGIFDDLEALVMPDLTALEHQLQDTAEQDGVTLTIRGLLQSMDLGIKDIDAILSDWTYPTTNDYSEVLSNIYDEIAAYTDTFTQFWADLQEYLDAVLYDLEHLEVNERNNWPEHGTPQLPDLDEETGIVPWEDVLNLTALRDAVTRLMDKFPFSTINNFVRILNWFVRPARAPVFDLPLPNPSDWSDPYMVNVDLSIWDTPAAVLRMGITIWASARMSRRTVAMWTREEGGGDA